MAKRIAGSARAGGVDFMALGAHPDDVELGCGGTILKLVSLGRKGVIVDLTDASMGTRGTPEIRAREAAAAARALGAGGDGGSGPEADRRSICCTLSGAMASTSTPSAQGLVESTTASSPNAWRTRVRASRDVRAVKRLTFIGSSRRSSRDPLQSTASSVGEPGP